MKVNRMKPVTLSEVIEEQKKDPEFILLYQAEQRLNRLETQLKEIIEIKRKMMEIVTSMQAIINTNVSEATQWLWRYQR